MLSFRQRAGNQLNRIDAENPYILLVIGVEVGVWCGPPTSMNIRIIIPKKRLSSGTPAFYLAGFKEPTPSADWNAGSNKNRSAAVGLGASVVGSDGAKVCRCAEVFEVGEPKKILTECEWNLKLKLASVAPLLDADIHERVVGTGTADSVRDKVTVFNAGELFEGSRLKNAPQGSVAVGLNAEPIWRVSLPIVMATIPKY